MEKRELVRDMVLATRSRLASDGWAVGLDADMHHPSKGRSVSVKIRVHKDLRKTMDFIETVLGDGGGGVPGGRNIDFLTIHARTRSTPSSTPIMLDALEILVEKYGDRVPILANGDIFTLNALPFQSPRHQPTATFADSQSGTVEESPLPFLPKLAGLMAARAILANPALYAGYDACPWEAVEKFMVKAARAPLPYKLVLHHVHEMCSPGMGANKKALLTKQERAELQKCMNMVDLIDFLEEKKGLER
jgi:tRNA-dihydrouridine synthase 4